MYYFKQIEKNDLAAYSKNWGWILTFGLMLIALGILAISYAAFSTLLSVIVIGSVLAVSGLVIIIDTFRSWWGTWSGFFLHLIIGLLYGIVGVMLISGPVTSSISLTLMLAIFYIIIGIFRISYAFIVPLPKQGLRVFNGIISLILGILILIGWPATGLFIIGLFVGIDLLFAGWVYIMAALTARSISKGA